MKKITPFDLPSQHEAFLLTVLTGKGGSFDKNIQDEQVRGIKSALNTLFQSDQVSADPVVFLDDSNVKAITPIVEHIEKAVSLIESLSIHDKSAFRVSLALRLAPKIFLTHVEADLTLQVRTHITDKMIYDLKQTSQWLRITISSPPRKSNVAQDPIFYFALDQIRAELLKSNIVVRRNPNSKPFFILMTIVSWVRPKIEASRINSYLSKTARNGEESDSARMWAEYEPDASENLDVQHPPTPPC